MRANTHTHTHTHSLSHTHTLSLSLSLYISPNGFLQESTTPIMQQREQLELQSSNRRRLPTQIIYYGGPPLVLRGIPPNSSPGLNLSPWDEARKLPKPNGSQPAPSPPRFLLVKILPGSPGSPSYLLPFKRFQIAEVKRPLDLQEA